MRVLLMLLWGVGIVLFALVLSGGSRALLQVLGRPILLCGGERDEQLGFFPELILTTSVFGFSVGMSASYLIGFGFLEERALSGRIVFGSVLGISYFGLRGHDRVRRFFQRMNNYRWHVMQPILGLVACIFGGNLAFFFGRVNEVSSFEVSLVAGLLAGLFCGFLGLRLSHEIYERKWGNLYGRLSAMVISPMLLPIVLSEICLKEPETQRNVIGGMLLGIACLTACVCEYLCRVPAIGGAERFAEVFTPILALLRHHTILCSHCLRYTSPFRSRYSRGKRYCEHCAEPVESTAISGHVILTFGTFSPAELQTIEDGRQRVFLRKNPVFGTIQANPKTGIFLSSTRASELGKQPIDVSEVYVDSMTCVAGHIERFITYVVNHPPKHGVESIRIFYKGRLDRLGKPLANALYNNFSEIHAI